MNRDRETGATVDPQVRFWRTLAASVVSSQATPFYLFSAGPVREALDELRVLGPEARRGAQASGLHPAASRRGKTVGEAPAVAREARALPVRHWLSCKTQPVAPLLRWWRKQGRPIEVVSEFEYLAARREGFETDQILLNGPAKHHWLPRHAAPRLRVNFDSPAELKALLPLAKQHRWRCGVRLRTSLEHDPENPKWPTQFGMERAELVKAVEALKRSSVEAETLHFHLRTNVAGAGTYERAIREAAEVCRAAKFQPLHLDGGGGLPPPFTWAHDGRAFGARFDLRELAAVFQRTLPLFPGLRELWLENGRFVLARSGVLVVQVLDVKERGGVRQLICDGGRTLSALVSNWERHRVFTLPNRRGKRVPTAVHGPTCMAFDQLGRFELPDTLRAGDHLVWMEAGAYHVPWETRFSHGLAAVLWHEDGKIVVARERESFEEWWSQWR